MAKPQGPPNRIASVKSTQKITKAMQMVAAAKLRRAQEAAEAARPYAERMDAVLANLAAAVAGQAGAPALLAGTGQDQVHLLVVATAERGLCGGFNSSIVQLAREHARPAARARARRSRSSRVGKKGGEQLKPPLRQVHRRARRASRGVKAVGFDNAQAIGQKMLALFEAGEFDVGDAVLRRFKSVIAQIPTAQQLIPADVRGGEAPPISAARSTNTSPSEEEILADLLPRNLAVQVFRALLENAASEQGARMSAMDNATRNAGDMINKLTIKYNRSVRRDHQGTHRNHLGRRSALTNTEKDETWQDTRKRH